MRRGNRHLVGVVLGGRSGGSRDAIMRDLLAENLEKAATKRTVAAIAERNSADANADVAEAEAASRPTQTVQVQGAVQVASAEPGAAPTVRSTAPASRSILANAAAAVPPPQAKAEPAPLTNGVIQTQQIAAIPGSSEPMKPVKVKTVQVKAGQVKLASASPAQPAPPVTNAIPPARSDAQEMASAMAAKAEINKAEAAKSEMFKAEMAKSEIAKSEIAKAAPARPEMPPQPANHGTGNGILGVLPASSLQQPASAPQPSPASHTLAYADTPPTTQPQPQAVQQNGAIKPVVVHTGWIVQVGALESETEAQQRIEAAREPGPRTAHQGRPVHRTGGRQGRQEAVPGALRRPRSRSGRGGMPGPEAFRHLLHHHQELTPTRPVMGWPGHARHPRRS